MVDIYNKNNFMNKSYSKIRHIQELNRRLDESRNEKNEEKYLFESFGTKNEKNIYLDLIEKQRILEENLKFGNKNFLFEAEEEIDVEDENLDDESGLETEEDYDEMIKLYPNEFKEFLQDFIKQVEASPEANEPESLSESLLDDNQALLILERCCAFGDNCYLADCFKKNTKFKRWMRRQKSDLRQFNTRLKRKFRDWMRNIKDIDLDIEFKKHKKRKKKKSRIQSKRPKSLQKTWAKNKRGTIKIGRARWLTFGKGKGSEYEEFDSEESQEPSIPEEQWATYLQENDGKMVSLMTKVSKQNWNTLKTDPDDIGYAVAVLERFNDTYEEKKWKKVGVGLDVNTFKQEIEQDPIISDIEGETQDYPYQTFDFPFDMASEPNLFVNNQWTEQYATVFSQQVDTLVSQVSEVLKGLNPPEGKPKGYIKALYLESSASRFRNGGLASDLSFLELSNKRLETAKQIIYNKLNSVGVGSDAQTLVSFKPEGANGDGSSGPNPPLKYGYVPKGNVKMEPFCASGKQECTIGGKVVKRNELGEPHATEKEYDKYKYIRGTIVIVFNDTVKKDPDVTPPKQDPKEFEPDFEIIETDTYPIYFYAPGKKPFRIPIPGIRIKWKKLFEKRSFVRRGIPTYGPPNKKPGSTKCEFFGENGR